MTRGVPASNITETSRRCHVCGEWKPKDDYAKDARTPDGRQARCRNCAAAYRKANRDQTKAAAQRHRGSARQQATLARWQLENADRIAQVRSARYRANKEVASSYVHARRARLRGGIHEVVDRAIVWERDQGVCRLCGVAANPADWHLEHLTPLVRGGGHTYDNTAVSHPRCNRMKGQMTLEEWMLTCLN